MKTRYGHCIISINKQSYIILKDYNALSDRIEKALEDLYSIKEILNSNTKLDRITNLILNSTYNQIIGDLLGNGESEKKKYSKKYLEKIFGRKLFNYQVNFINLILNSPVKVEYKPLRVKKTYGSSPYCNIIYDETGSIMMLDEESHEKLYENR